MATRIELPPVPGWLAALPFLAASKFGGDKDLVASSALGSAAAALAADADRRDSRSRLCFLIAELASQFGRRTGDHAGWIPVDRRQLARAAETSLPKVKRILGFLLLSGVIELGERGIRILDWKRLCRLGAYDRSWTSLPADEIEKLNDEETTQSAEAAPPLLLTIAGDQASFV